MQGNVWVTCRVCSGFIHDTGPNKFMLSLGFCSHKKLDVNKAWFKSSFQRGGAGGGARGYWALLLHPAGQNESPQSPQPASQPKRWSRGRGRALRRAENQLPPGSAHRPRRTFGWFAQLRSLPGRCGRAGHDPGSAGVFQTKTQPTAGARLQRAAEEHLRLPQDFGAGGHLEAEGSIPLSSLLVSVYLNSMMCYI